MRFFVLLFLVFLFVFPSSAQGTDVFYVTNLNRRGEGSFVRTLEKVNQSTKDACVIYFNQLSGNIPIDTCFTISKSLQIYGDNDVQLTYGGKNDCDNFLFLTGDIVYLSNLNFNNLVEIHNSSSAVIDNCNSAELIFNNVSDLRVFGGKSGGITVTKGDYFLLDSHRNEGTSYALKISKFNSNGIIFISNCKFGEQENSLINSIENFGIRIENSLNLKSIRVNNSLVSTVFVSGNEKYTSNSIDVENCSAQKIEINNNEIGGNFLEPYKGTFGFGVHLENVQGDTLEVKNNTIHHVRKDAIYLEDINNISVINNQIAADTNEHIARNGIVLKNVRQSLIRYNSIGKVSYSPFPEEGYGIRLLNSSNNQVNENFVGLWQAKGFAVINDLSTVHASCIYLDSLSNNNLLKQNFVGLSNQYGIENHGSNSFISNYITCNKKGLIWNAIDTLQNMIFDTPVVKTDANQLSISVKVDNLPLPDGYKIDLYRSGPCQSFSGTDLLNTYIDSVFIQSGSFEYFFKPNTQPSSEEITPSVLQSGDSIYYTVSKPNGVLISSSSRAHIANGITSLSKKGDRKTETYIYPNPSDDRITFFTSKPWDEYAIYDVSMKLVMQGSYAKEVYLGQVAKGIYTVVLKSNDNSKVLKLVKK